MADDDAEVHKESWLTFLGILQLLSHWGLGESLSSSHRRCLKSLP